MSIQITESKQVQSYFEGAAKAKGGKDFYADISQLPEHQVEQKAPYSYLAEDGMIVYNGTVFVCDDEKNRITLGDVSDRNQCINIPLAKGGSLLVNRDCIGSLMKAIGMFSPEDKVRIMKAVSLDNKIQEMKMEIDEDTNSIGDGTTNTAEGGERAASTITDSMSREEEQTLAMGGAVWERQEHRSQTVTDVLGKK